MTARTCFALASGLIVLAASGCGAKPAPAAAAAGSGSAHNAIGQPHR